ncbi:MAG: response regulator transcription factor [Deltaproteobacteria bacterium]|nr:response regulator transcription factor [Deltaproteobacteria bacterium]
MPEAKKIRVVIADDESHVRKYMGTIMKRMNCEIVAEAPDGKAAAQYYSKLKPHMLLLDINMPVMSGKNALKVILKKHPNAFVIMLTSLVDKDTIEDCLRIGASGYLRKDIPPEEIKPLIISAWKAYKKVRGNNNDKPSA